jgi:hypothetical protein
MRLLLVNANTDSALTRRLAQAARAAASCAARIMPLTASPGLRPAERLVRTTAALARC